MTTENTTLLSEATPPAAETEQAKPGTDAAPVADPTPEGTPPAAESETGKDEPAAKPEEGEKAPASIEITAPEGVELDAVAVGEFVELAKELNLPPEKAQAVADIGIKMVQRAQAAAVEARAVEVEGWLAAVKADPEIGGAKLDANLSLAAKAIDTFAPELRELFDQTGLGNHPVMVKAFVAIGKAIAEDTFLGTGQHAPGAVDPAKRMFPYMN